MLIKLILCKMLLLSVHQFLKCIKLRARINRMREKQTLKFCQLIEQVCLCMLVCSLLLYCFAVW